MPEFKWVAPKNLIVLGAGASYGSQRGLGVPALGSGLFDALARHDPTHWGSLSREIASRFQSDFEQGWSLLQADPKQLPTSVLLRTMAHYFCQFEVARDSLYLDLGRRIRKARWDGSFVSLNYDRLLIEALAASDNYMTIFRRDRPDAVQVCLPHGACFLFCDGAFGDSGRFGLTKGATLALRENARFFLGANGAFFVDPSGYVDGDPIIVGDRFANAKRLLEDTIPPIMSYYEPGKRANAGESVLAELRENVAALTAAAENIAIVGVQVRDHDEHIWGPLAQTGARLLYCGGRAGAASFEAWRAKFRTGRADTVYSDHFLERYSDICTHVGL